MAGCVLGPDHDNTGNCHFVPELRQDAELFKDRAVASGGTIFAFWLWASGAASGLRNEVVRLLTASAAMILRNPQLCQAT